ncbi:MAG: Rrf2 family transcriptional regulator [Bacteroidales bacterium]|nr:Rrf2 family transcriptional regulator [Bacteroidales bacterium]
MSMLSNTCKYAIRGTIYLALHEGKNHKIGIKKIAEDLDIPTPFLAKILQNLVKHKILSSTKGPHGGFGLEKDPADISLLEIIEVTDGMDMFYECLIGLPTCRDHDPDFVPCPLNRKFRPISQQLYDLFKEETISNLKEEIEHSEGKVAI